MHVSDSKDPISKDINNDIDLHCAQLENSSTDTFTRTEAIKALNNHRRILEENLPKFSGKGLTKRESLVQQKLHEKILEKHKSLIEKIDTAIKKGKEIECEQKEDLFEGVTPYKLTTSALAKAADFVNTNSPNFSLLREKASEALSPSNVISYALPIAAQATLPSSNYIDTAKFALACAIISYSLAQWITTKAPDQSTVAKVLERAVCIWALMQVHALSYAIASAGVDQALRPLQEHDLVSSETRQGFSVLSAIGATGIIVPNLILRASKLLRQSQAESEQAKGLATQRDAKAALPQGSTTEVSLALQTYAFFSQQLSNLTADFQYGLVALNVLKDQGPVMKKLRNVWILAGMTLSDLSKHLANETVKLGKDAATNAMTYSVIREGKMIENVRRDALVVGDLIRLSDTLQEIHDAKSGETRYRSLLSGYLIQLSGGEPLQPVISLVALNGESKPLILSPPRHPKAKIDCIPIDSSKAQDTSSIASETIFISFDNSGKKVSPDQLYLQIADAPRSEQSHPEKVAFSTKQTAALQNKLILAVLALSTAATFALTPFSLQNKGTLAAIAYATGLIDNFSQVFGQLQTLIPLTAPVMSSLINQSLVSELNRKLGDLPISVNNALLVADIFEFLKKGLVRIYSDKTGTVTETRMEMKGFVGLPELDERVISAFATTYSDQKTEEEENEIRRYYAAKGIKIESEMVAGDSKSLTKSISKENQVLAKFKSTRIGLFTDFGGQFTLRHEEGKDPVLVFCGVPKEFDDGDKFKNTSLMQNYTEYANTASLPEHQIKRQDSLTRDWCIAEAKLSPESHQALLDSLNLEDPNTSKQTLKNIIQKVKGDFQYLGTFQIDNPIKPGARDAIRDWNAKGIGFMMITGDTRNAAKMIAKKLYPDRSEHVYEAGNLPQDFASQDLSKSTVVLSDTTPATLDLLDKLEAMKAKKPNIIFSQMKEADKGKLVEHAKANGFFIIANGDGSNDLQMLHAAHVAIGDAALDGSFARGVHEASNLTDLQVKQLMGATKGNFYELFDLHSGQESKFLKEFARISNTQPKIVTALLVKSMKSLALTSALGWVTEEMKGQFPMMLAYDAAFLGALKHLVLSTADTQVFDKPLDESIIPYMTLGSAVAVAGTQSFYHYFFSERQITNIPTLLINLTTSVMAMRVALGSPLVPSTST